MVSKKMSNEEFSTEYLRRVREDIYHEVVRLMPRELQFKTEDAVYNYVRDYVLVNPTLSNWANAALATWWFKGNVFCNIVDEIGITAMTVKHNRDQNHIGRLVYMANTYFLETKDLHGFVERMGIDNLEIYVRCKHNLYAFKCD